MVKVKPVAFKLYSLFCMSLSPSHFRLMEMDLAFALGLFSGYRLYKWVTRCQGQRVLVIFFQFSELFIKVQHMYKKIYKSKLCSSVNFYKVNTCVISTWIKKQYNQYPSDPSCTVLMASTRDQ